MVQNEKSKDHLSFYGYNLWFNRKYKPHLVEGTKKRGYFQCSSSQTGSRCPHGPSAVSPLGFGTTPLPGPRQEVDEDGLRCALWSEGVEAETRWGLVTDGGTQSPWAGPAVSVLSPSLVFLHRQHSFSNKSLLVLVFSPSPPPCSFLPSLWTFSLHLSITRIKMCTCVAPFLWHVAVFSFQLTCAVFS